MNNRSVMKRVLGIDIGGANLKLAAWRDRDDVVAAVRPFALWKQPDALGRAVQGMVDQLGGGTHLAVTMTGEMADCYSSRRQGVHRILDQLRQVFSEQQIHVYAVGGAWLSVDDAARDPWRVASSNWHALANWLCHWPPTSALCENALLVDVGSTTTDIIPLTQARVDTPARTDRNRLELGHLVYTGVRRTPVMAVTPSLQFRSKRIPVIAEWFASVDDAYLVAGLVREEEPDCDTADGQPRTLAHAQSRLSRMIGEDSEELTQCEMGNLAQQVIDAQAFQIYWPIHNSLRQLRVASSGSIPYLLCSGHGQPLLDRCLHKVTEPYHRVLLVDFLPELAIRCAPAAGVAWLLEHQPA